MPLIRSNPQVPILYFLSYDQTWNGLPLIRLGRICPLSLGFKRNTFIIILHLYVRLTYIYVSLFIVTINK
uniref:Uncharacterized protein n=1 Tax=Picea glauca TaxID=3330 RepID=A0A124GN94_PICGL|nr:hypothetical protein ABT39_MTgene5074 [Picea glauca]